MTVKSSLPVNFKIGQQVEAKSFEEGYRGAWFRCKIKGCSKKSKEPTVALDYLDYEDYKNYWINLYEHHSSLAEKRSDSENKHLMLRPSYPQICHQSQMPDTCVVLETVGIVDGTWEVGDMVDWFRKGCYWSAQIARKGCYWNLLCPSFFQLPNFMFNRMLMPLSGGSNLFSYQNLHWVKDKLT